MDASPFAKLSPELRLRIYELVLCQPYKLRIAHNAFKLAPFHYGPWPNGGTQYGPILRPEDVRTRLRDDHAEWLLAITQTCRQIRIEATDVLYAVNDFYIYYSRLSRGQVLRPEHNPTITCPIIKFLDAVETHFETSQSRFPVLRIKIFVHRRCTFGTTDPNKEEPMVYMLRTLLELTKAYKANGRALDLVVVLGTPLDSSEGHQIVIKNGFSCMGNLIFQANRSVNFFRPDSDVEMWKRWQQVFVP